MLGLLLGECLLEWLMVFYWYGEIFDLLVGSVLFYGLVVCVN